MRMVCAWDGSGHGLKALRDIGALFRPDAFTHVEGFIFVWPTHDTALWRDIAERTVLVDDSHRAAAEVANEAAETLGAVLSSWGHAARVTTYDGDIIASILAAVKRARADILFLIIGPHTSAELVANLHALMERAEVTQVMIHSVADPV